MSLLSRKKALLAKIESVYGTDSTPGSTNAMLVRNLNITPLSSQLVSRDLYRPYLGNSQQLIAEKSVLIDFEIELVSSGVLGVAPGWASLLKACGFGEAVNTAAISSITRSSSTATATKTAHGLSVGDVVKISGATETEYNGNQTVLSVPTADTFTFAVTGTPATPASGSPVLGVSVVYSPVSTAFASLSMYFNIDGVLHKIIGARGTVEFNIAVKQIPTMKFNFTGLYSTPTDSAAPSTDYSAFQTPKIANTANTPAFSLFGYSGYLESMSLNMANDVQYRTLVGYEAVELLDRKPTGQFQIEAPTMAAKNFFSIAEAGTHGAMSITHGLVNGFKVKLDAPNVSLGNPSYQDSQGVQMLQIPFVPEPTSAGNDEVTITAI